jgi:hypothetical protein
MQIDNKLSVPFLTQTKNKYVILNEYDYYCYKIVTGVNKCPNNTNIVKYYYTKINKLQLDEDEEEQLK